MNNARPVKQTQKLSFRLIRNSFMVIVLSLVSIATVFTVSTSNEARENLFKDLEVMASVLGNRSSAALIFGDVRTAEKNLSSANYRESVISVCLFDAFGSLFARYTDKNLQGSCPATAAADQRISGEADGVVSVWDNVVDSGETIGSILIQASTQHIRDSLTRALITTTIAFAVIIFLAYFVLRRLIEKTLSSLTSLHDTALKISRDPFSELRAERMQNDEVGRLVDVFNAMLDNLNSENAALHSSERRFRTLAQNSPVGIYQMNERRELVFANEKWFELTRLPADSSNTLYLNHVHDEDEEVYLSVLNKVQDTRLPQVLEYRYQQPDSDEKRIFMEHIAPVLSASDSGKQFEGFIGSLQDISDLKNAQMELENLAFYDPLTNLPNRRFFRDHLHYVVAAANHEENRIAIMMLDLDNFKKVNDTLGHDAGDELLSALSERLRGLVAQKDVVSRMGGDEFMILLRDVDIRSSIQRIADRILKAVKRPVHIRDQDIEVSASIGIATYPEDALSAEELMRNADLALYLSKESGRNRLSFFSRKLETLVNEKVQLERKLRTALKGDALTFHVQPQWCLRTGRLVSGEVLMRWIDEDEGPIGPNRFIPVAEEAGLILEMGDWLIDKVFESISKHRKELEMLGIKSLAINLSARQFFSNKLALTIDHALKTYNIDPAMIELELTESAVMEDSELAVRIMERLKSIGCRLSIDDFGTGYSSLSYLKKFPIDAVKIDQSFISDIPGDQNDVEISAAIIAMGHNLGLEVVAEGVETQEQMDFLLREKCDFAQGYMIAKPMPFEALFDSVPEINQRIDGLISDKNEKLG
ncbi:MAG: diguanylate cyclase [Oleiphilus sp.]|nr:MAG: diguanylate cyclase [Oleiphilus sp.]